MILESLASRIVLFLFLVLPSIGFSQQSGVQNLRLEFENSTNDTARINAAKRLFGNYVYSKADSAIFYAEGIVAIGESMKSDAYVLTGNNYLGIASSVSGNFEKAAIYMQRVLDIHRSANDSLNIAYSLNNLGTNYLYAGNYLEAAQALIESVTFKEALVNSGSSLEDVDLSSTLQNIGIAYESQQDTAQAKTYYLRAIEEGDKAGAIVMSARAKSSLGSILIAAGNFEEALGYLVETEKVFVEANDVFSLSKIYNNIALAYAELNQPRQVISFANKAIEKSVEIGNQKSEGLGYMFVGLGNIKLNNFRAAIPVSIKTLQIGEEIDAPDLQHSALKNLYEAYEGLGNYKQAYDYSVQHKAIGEKIFDLKRSEQMEQLTAKYEADKRELEIDNLNQETELQSLQLDKANSERNLLILLLVSAVAIIGLVVYFYGQIVENRKELRNKNGELEKLNKTKDRFFAIVSHDLRGHISSFQGTGRLFKHFLVKKDEEKLENIATEIDKNANNLSNLLDNLLHWSVDQLKGYKPKPEQIEVSGVVAELIATFKPLADVKNVNLLSEVDENTMIMADRGSFFVTMRNLIANALKFTEEGSVTIFSKKEKDNFLIGIRDTGIGIPDEMKAQLFTIGEEKIRRGTQNEKGTGLGLNLAFEFTKMNGGRLEVESVEGEGTTFLVYLAHA